MIKKAVMVGAMASLMLTACSSQSTDESNISNIDTSTAIEQKVTADEESAAVTEESTATAAIAFTEENLTALEKEVAAIEEKAAGYTASGTAEENRTSYMAIDQEMELIEEQIDQYEDGTETNYYEGTITQAEYQEKEYQLEQLENRLDAAKATLELKYGIDD